VLFGVIACGAWTNLALAEERDGELVIYEQEASDGTVARRVWRDADGRVTKATYYQLKSPEKREKGRKPPYTQEVLEPRSVVKYDYDEKGREIREVHRTAGMRVVRFADLSYDDKGRKSAMTWRRENGTREYEIRYSDGKSVSHLYFDYSGETVVSARGVLPDDLDQKDWWGEPCEGLVCHIAALSGDAALVGIRIGMTVKNETDHGVRVANGVKYEMVQMELRDEKGDMIPSLKLRYHRVASPGGEETNFATIPPGQAEDFAHTDELADWFPYLRAGRYTLVVKRRVSADDFPLTSNAIVLTVRPAEGVTPAPPGLPAQPSAKLEALYESAVGEAAAIRVDALLSSAAKHRKACEELADDTIIAARQEGVDIQRFALAQFRKEEKRSLREMARHGVLVYLIRRENRPDAAATLASLLESEKDFYASAEREAIPVVAALEELGAGMKAVPFLLGALSSGSDAVRAECHEHLKKISGKDFGFDPLATREEREAAVDRWRKWWRSASGDAGTRKG
jgi:hypothetical protein